MQKQRTFPQRELPGLSWQAGIFVNCTIQQPHYYVVRNYTRPIAHASKSLDTWPRFTYLSSQKMHLSSHGLPRIGRSSHPELLGLSKLSSTTQSPAASPTSTDPTGPGWLKATSIIFARCKVHGFRRLQQSHLDFGFATASQGSTYKRVVEFSYS